MRPAGVQLGKRWEQDGCGHAEGRSEGAAHPIQGMLQGAAWLPARVFSLSGFLSTTLHTKGKRGKAQREGERVFLVLSSGAVLFLSAADSVNAFPGRQLALY